jgi:hypothetical protein
MKRTKSTNLSKPKPVPQLPLVEYNIVHSIGDRFRLKIPLLQQDEFYSSNLEKLILSSPIITDYRFNLDASSLVVSYSNENTNKQDFLNYLDHIIRKATLSEPITNNLISQQENNMALPILALVTSVVAAPFELPLVVVGGIIVAAAGPLWQRVSNNRENPINFDSVDALWLSSQLLLGNPVAAALALNLSQVGENFRQTNIKQIENQLNFPEDPKLTETELLGQIQPITQRSIIPILVLAGITGIVTNDFSRASAWLPLNFGLSLRGITPLAVVSALEKAEQYGVYIPDGKTLEKLAQVDALVVSNDSAQEQGKNLAYIEGSYLVLGQDGSKIELKDQDDLQNIEESITLSQQTISTIYQSIGIATSLNLSAVFLGVFLGVDPVITVLINAGAAIAGELNSFKLHSQNLPL